MAKRTPIIETTSYGIYSHWDANSKDLPKIAQFTNTVTAEEGVEFGFIVNIKKAKGTLLNYCIYHPGIINKKGKVLAPFDGEIYVRSNDWNFYLGDTIQLLHPVDGLESNLGEWRMVLEMQGKIIAAKTFRVVGRDEAQFWKQRGF
ncbi:DUF3859 domain-containing protein [Vibrio breoganii]|uniref:DUF3859 domain-containing protein n=1 Tax=Vibrio breoganii TaxID=553239 RepID=UPI0003075C6A|nr:DUF3859 domain-containing protein [Vibrio breoganii]OED94363.1 hypothetical protein A1QG_06415 [Vibrio breoganii ZF-29]